MTIQSANIQRSLYDLEKRIEKLESQIMPWYHYEWYAQTPAALVEVLISDTDAPAGTDHGFLMDTDANIYKITGCTDTKLYIEYWATIGTGGSNPQLI